MATIAPTLLPRESSTESLAQLQKFFYRIWSPESVMPRPIGYFDGNSTLARATAYLRTLESHNANASGNFFKTDKE